MTEHEKKLLLTKAEYNYLLDLFKSETMVKQTNYYFDTDDLSMNRQNITCRIRLKDGKYKGTMKQHSLNTDHSTETEMKVFDGIHDNAFIDMGLKLQGILITERCVILKDSTCEVVLDKNKYLGYTDYELEIEYSPGHEKNSEAILQAIQDILKCCNTTLTSDNNKNAESKSTRFFRKLKNKQNHDI